MPYLMLKDKQGKTPLQIAIDKKDMLMTTNLLDLLIKGDKKGVIYSEFINPHLFELKKLGIELKSYFNSLIAYHKIDENNKNFVPYHTNSDEKTIISNAKSIKILL
jgi:hypothetical protein